MLAQAFSLRENLRSLFSPPSSHFTPINGLRALSILWVYAFHVPYFVSEMLPAQAALQIWQRPALKMLFHGHFGVDVFFVISGFLIGNMLLEEQDRNQTIAFGRFYWRRFVRLCPLYFFIMLWLIATLKLTHNDAVPLQYAWTNFLYVNNFVPVRKQFMAWTWSLAIEEQFYLVCPLLIAMLPRRHAMGWLLGLLALGVLIRLGLLVSASPPVEYVFASSIDENAFVHYYETIYNKPYTRFGGLLCGVLAAYAYRYTSVVRQLSERAWLSAGALLLALLPIAYVLQRVDYLDFTAASEPVFLALERYLVAAGIAVLLLLSLSTKGIGRWLGAALSHRALFPIAQLSYAIYLFHPLVLYPGLEAFFKGATVAPSGAQLAWAGLILGVVSLIASAGLHLAIEKPGMRLR